MMLLLLRYQIHQDRYDQCRVAAAYRFHVPNMDEDIYELHSGANSYEAKFAKFDKSCSYMAWSLLGDAPSHVLSEPIQSHEWLGKGLVSQHGDSE